MALVPRFVPDLALAPALMPDLKLGGGVRCGDTVTCPGYYPFDAGGGLIEVIAYCVGIGLPAVLLEGS